MLVDWIGVLLRRSDIEMPSHAAVAQRFSAAAAELSGTPVILPAGRPPALKLAVCGDMAACKATADATLWQRMDSSDCELLLSGRLDGASGASARLLGERWSAEGEAAFATLNGRFSAVLYEPMHGRLRAVRDHIGHEPFYYIQAPDYFAFSTSFKALRAFLAGEETPDELGIADYLALTHRDRQRTLLNEIRRLPPAHWLDLTPDFSVTITRYWSLRECSMQRYDSAESCYEQFQNTVVQAVETESALSMRTGLMLSGGLDSSSLGAAYYKTARGAVSPLYAIGSTSSRVLGDEPLADESPFMKAFGRHYPKTELHIEAATGSMLGNIERDVREIGFPHRDIYSYELRSMAQLASDAGCDLMITGLGGDFFASSKVGNFFAYQFFSGRWRSLVEQARVERGNLGFIGWARLVVGQVARPLLSRWWKTASIRLGLTGNDWCRPERMPLQPDFAKRTDFGRRASTSLLAIGHPPNIIRGALEADAEFTESGIVAHMLEYVAALSRAHGIQISNPLLDRRVVNFAATAPLEFRRRGKGLRSLIRHAFSALLPPEIAERTSKGNFISAAIARNSSTTDAATQSPAAGSAEWQPFIDPQKLGELARSWKNAGASPAQQMERLLPLYVSTGVAHFLNENKSKATGTKMAA